MAYYVLASVGYFSQADKVEMVGALAEDLLTPSGSAPIHGVSAALEQKMRYPYADTMGFLKDQLQQPTEENELWKKFRERFSHSPLTQQQFTQLGTALVDLGVLKKER